MEGEGQTRRLATWLGSVIMAVGFVVFAVPAESSAQSVGEGVADFNVQTFQPVIGPHGTFTLERAETIGHLETTGGIYLDYLSEPFVVNRTEGSTQSIVDQQFVADLVAGIGFFDRARLGVHLPVYFANSGTIGDESYSGSGIGDLTFQPKVRLLKQPEAPLGLGLLTDVSIPTGDADRFIGASTATVAPMVLADRRIGRTTIETNLGLRFLENQSVRDVPVGNRFTYGLGAEYAVVQDLLRVGVELFGHTPLEEPFGQTGSSPLETLVGAKVSPSPGITISTGVGAGIVGGIGAPEVRAFVGVSYVPTDEADGADPDGDDIKGEADECPKAAEDFDGFEDADGCPDPDNDGDGIPDDQDACPGEAAEGTDDGCPPEETSEQTPEADKQESAAESDDTQGARQTEDKKEAVAKPADPTDSDDDGIPDSEDKCPEMAGVGYRDGCPPTTRKVELKESSIDVLEKIYFETGSATLKEESYELLDQVALLLRLNPQIERIEIQGHTDNTGNKEKNQTLSENRAESVRAYLVDEAGISGDRLTAEGYGATKPKVPNVSDENRSRNRRVEFVIVVKGPADEGSREGGNSDGAETDGNDDSQ